MKIFRTAKEEGCKFYFGSDSHHPEEFASPLHYVKEAVETLGLTEDDKINFILNESHQKNSKAR